jgi:hypothetical protein
MNSLRSSALLLVLLVVGCLLVLHTPTPMSMVGRTLQRQGPVHKSPEQLCSHLQGTRAAGLCDTYASALGSHARFAAAIAWKQTEAASCKWSEMCAMLMCTMASCGIIVATV